MKDRRKLIPRIVLAAGAIFLLYTIYSIFSVPDLCDLKKVNPRTTAFMELRKEQWEEKKLNRKVDHRWVPLSSVSKHLKNAVLAAEDPNFYSHHGLDFYALWLAVKRNVREFRIVYGASTITQQLVKNLYLSPSRSPIRKWREAILALRLERCVSKNRILEVYLNVIEWGESTYGIEAASRRYFGKSASALNPAEAATLAAMIPNPVYYNPSRRRTLVIQERNSILKIMLRQGRLSRADYDRAIRQ